MKHPVESEHEDQPVNKKFRVGDGGIADDNKEAALSPSDKTPTYSDSEEHSSLPIDSSPEGMKIDREQSRPFVLARVESSGEVRFTIESVGRPTTNVSERKPKESGDGDHVTPYSVFLDVVYAAVEDSDAKDIPEIIKETSKIFLKASPIQESISEELEVDQQKKIKEERFKEDLELLRSQRKSLSRSLYRLHSSRPEEGYTGVISTDKIPFKSDRVERALDEISDDGFREQIINNLKNTERLHIANFVADRAQEFIANLNLEDDVSFSKSRVKDQRKGREDELHRKIRLYQIDETSVVDRSEKITEAHIERVKSHIRSKDSVDRTEDDIKMLTDIAYHERVRGEGARVNMALKGLRAFDKLIAIKSQLTTLDENSEISAEDRIAAKKELIDDLRTNSDIKDGLRGTEKNPLFGVNNINSIISADGNDLNIAEEQWKELSKKAGTLFARLFDYERVEYPYNIFDEGRSDKDLEKLYDLSAKHLAFMCCAFKNLTTIPPAERLEAVKGFSSAILEDQDWNKAQTESGALDQDRLIKKIQSRITTQLYTLFPSLQNSDNQCRIM